MADNKALGCDAFACIAQCDACEKAAIYQCIESVACTASEAVTSAECAACNAAEALSCVCNYSETIDAITCAVNELTCAIQTINCNIETINENITNLVSCTTCLRCDLNTVIGTDTGCSMRVVAGEVYDCCSQ